MITEFQLDRTPHVLIVEAAFYRDIAEELAAGAIAALKKAGVTYDRLEVPGALEVPAAIAFAEQGGRFDAFLALGCVIRGETSHYDIVCEQSAMALQMLAIDRALCIGNGILTVENRDQAMARAKVGEKNKGADVANAALRMLAVKAQFTPEMLQSALDETELGFARGDGSVS